MSTRRPRGGWWRRKQTEQDFSAEIQAHLALEADRLAADGLDPHAARDAARRAFGNVGRAEERFYETNRWMWLDHLRQDVRYALRSLWRTRAFVSTVVLTLSVGLGLLTALFAVLDTYVLRPMAIHEPQQVYSARYRSPNTGGFMFRLRDFEELRTRRDLFDDVAAQRRQLVTSTDRSVYAAFVTGNYFGMLRPAMRLGRSLADFDTRTPGEAPVAVLGDQGWARLFDRDPNVLGRTVELNGRKFEVVGVTGPQFQGMDDMPVEVWAPLTMYEPVSGQDVYDATTPPRLTIFTRLRRDVSQTQAEEALRPFMLDVARREAEGQPPKAEGLRAELESRATPNPLTVELVAMLAPVFAAFGLVLLAACANVSNVMLARAIARHREIGIRLSVGASRGRIVRQLLTEALLISLIAGLAGLALGSFVLGTGRRVLFETIPASMTDILTIMPLEVDYRVFLFSLAVAALTTLFFALVPALQATRLSLTDALRGQPAPGVRSGRLRDLLVAGQVTVSLVLLIAAVTLARNGASLAAIDLGFRTDGVMSINQRSDTNALIPPAAQALEREPQVAGSVAVTNRNPLFGRFPSIAVKPAGHETTQTTSYVFVSPEYFPMLEIPILRGRTFRPNEAQAEARVGILSQRAANAFWPGRDPIGQVLRITPSADRPRSDLEGYSDILIVGVAGDAVSGMIYDGTDTALLYMPTSSSGSHAGALLLRGPDGGLPRRDQVLGVLERVHRDRETFELLPLSAMVEIMVYPMRAASWIGSLLGLVALVLSVSGLYGVLMYVLGQRKREIGIRMALGATTAGVVRLVMRQSARVVGVGAAIGVVFAFAALKLLASVVTLPSISLLDGWAFAIGLTLIAAAAGVATFFPARRATRVDPVKTLRADA